MRAKLHPDFCIGCRCKVQIEVPMSIIWHLARHCMHDLAPPLRKALSESTDLDQMLLLEETMKELGEFGNALHKAIKEHV